MSHCLNKGKTGINPFKTAPGRRFLPSNEFAPLWYFAELALVFIIVYNAFLCACTEYQ